MALESSKPTGLKGLNGLKPPTPPEQNTVDNAKPKTVKTEKKTTTKSTSQKKPTKNKGGRPPKKGEARKELNTKKVNTYLNEDIYTKLEQSATDNDTTVANLVRKIIKDYVNNI